MARVREDELIPYEARDLTADRVLALAAHPDDEMLGAGGLLALCGERGSAVRSWIATGGTAQEGADPADRAAYGEKRREESRRAAAALQLDAPAFGGLSDRALADDPEALSRAVAGELAAYAPGLLLCPS